jgi:hypothetical protein
MLNNKRNKKIEIVFFFLLIMFFIFLINNAKAELIKLDLKHSPPCLPEESNCGDTSLLENYINLIARFALGIGGFLAMGMILIGAFLITVSGSVDKTREGQSYITSALLGLALLLGSYLILKEINPNLVILTPPTTPGMKLQVGYYGYGDSSLSGKQGSGKQSGEEVVCSNLPGSDQRKELCNIYCNPEDETKTKKEHEKVLDRLYKDYQIPTSSLKTNRECSSLCKYGCTSLAYMPERVINFLKELYETSTCQITITGASEFVGHKAHGPGIPMVDVRETKCLADFIKNKQKFDNLRKSYVKRIHNCFEESLINCKELNAIYPPTEEGMPFCYTLSCEKHFHFDIK